MTDDHEARFTQLEEDMMALHGGLDDFYSRLEACAEVLALVVQRATTLDERAAIDMAKSIDRMIELRRSLTTQPDKAGTTWLVQIRDDLVSWHKMRPEVLRAIADGRIRVDPRDRLKLVKDDVQVPPSPGSTKDPT